MQNDLISRSVLLAGANVRKVTEYDEGGWGLTYRAVPEQAIKNAPAVDAAPVVHGKWLPVSVDPADPYFRCSVCHYGTDTIFNGGDEPFKYCPNCGAKMDGGTK